ncbi:MAG TPA: cysteine peptidase family C39 domain-containing protein, partial [Polyangiaceae bacterium]|nr:cysteine peptidase family C39 domain-containing protein [Polyangiaceae bacterium]
MAIARTKAGRRVRTPTRLQQEATECGAAALAIVLEFFGYFVPLSVLREQCGVSRDGSKAANILKAARTYGLEARGFRKEPNEVRGMPMPVIVHWNFNHFLVVEGFSKASVYLNDPALGRSRVSHADFDRGFTGVVLTLQPTERFVPSGRRPSVWPALLRRTAGVQSAFVLVTFAGALLAVPSLAIPLFSKVFVDEILIGGHDDWLLPLLGGMTLAAALQAALAYLQKSQLLRSVMQLGVTMSGQFVWHALRLPMSFYFARSPGDIASRVALNDAVSGRLSGRLSGVFLNLLLVCFYGALLFYLSTSVALIGFVTLTLHLLLLHAAKSRRIDLGRVTARHRGSVAAVGAGGLQMIETIKATAAENDFFAHWAGHQAKLAIAQQDADRHDQTFVTLGSLLVHLNTLAVLCVGALQVIDGQMTAGTLVAVQSLMRGFVQPGQGLLQAGAELQKLRGDLERLDDVVQHERDPSADRAPGGEPTRLSGELELCSVTFGHLP